MHSSEKKYIDGFVFPLREEHLQAYQKVAQQVAEIWKEHGALEYVEYVGDDHTLEGVRSFLDAVDVQKDEVVILGWVTFPSKEIRDQANAQVPQDKRMHALVTPLMDPDNLIFVARRMVYGGFKPLTSA